MKGTGETVGWFIGGGGGPGIKGKGEGVGREKGPYQGSH